MVHVRPYLDDLVARREGARRLMAAWPPKAVADLTARLSDADLMVSFEKSVIAGCDPQVSREVHGALARPHVIFK